MHAPEGRGCAEKHVWCYSKENQTRMGLVCASLGTVGWRGWWWGILEWKGALCVDWDSKGCLWVDREVGWVWDGGVNSLANLSPQPN